LVVKTLELGTATGGAQLGMKDFVGLCDFSGVLGLHKDGVNDVAVEVAANQRAVMAAGAGWSDEFASLISADLTSGFEDACTATVGLGVIMQGTRESVGVGLGGGLRFGRNEGGLGCLCGTLVLTSLVNKTAHERGRRTGRATPNGAR
jgi:hypothetical protein